MNRFLLFLCFLCIPWVARGQAAYDWLYWFDSDDANKHVGVSSSLSFNIQAEADGLDEGFHAIHVQVADTAGRFSPPKTQMFFHTGNRAVKTLRYWFDNDVKVVYQQTATEGVLLIDVSKMEPGLHYIYCQVEDAAGNMSDVTVRPFYRQVRGDAMSWTYWFDEQEDAKTTIPYPGEVVMLDVSGLQDGFHTFHSQMSEVAASDIVTRMFIKIPQTEGVGDMTCICTVDNKLMAEEKVSPKGGVLNWKMNVDSLDVGIHKAMFQVITPSGAASSIAERYFVREITSKELGSMKCVYSLDNFQTSAQAGTMADGLFHFDLDVSSMEDGLHRIAYMLVSEQGITTSQKTAFFWKTPQGGSGIVQYDYWLNDDGPLHSVQLTKRVNPFSLISLLPVETMPLRSSCFHFETKDGQPMIYAKNDFHLRFYDTSAKSANETKQYVDYNVSQAVEPVGAIQPTQTFDHITENAIRWYTLQAEEGDTLAFRMSQAATIQLFAPSGEEIYSAQGSTSVAWGGCHAWEDGTYYLAVHDVTGSQNRMTLEYMHMDKYDVVDWDVHTVGNGGCSTITFNGNGFKDLYAVDLYTANGDTIHHVDIGHESDATTSVTFDFTDTTLGKYHAIFHFAGEDKRFSNILTVEEAVDIELATIVTTPSTFLRGNSTTYTINITNRGNMTAYRIPIDIQIATKTKNAITKAVFSKNVPAITIDGLDTTNISNEDITQINAYIKEKGDLLHFVTTYDSISNNYVKVCLLTYNIAPLTTLSISLTLNSSEAINYQTRVPSVWRPYSLEKSSEYARKRGPRLASVKENMCCYREKVECVMNIIVSAADFASFFVGPQGKLATCIADLGNTVLQFSYDVWCGEEHGGKDMRKAAEDLVWDAVNGLIGCATNIPGLKKLGTLDWVYQHIYNNISTTMDCVSAIMQKIPNCPPDPPIPHTSNPVNSIDPNDIYGYTSESGSKFITDSIQTVNYTIEFENDTTFATASAHTVVVKDTLDSKYFDLASYTPTGIKIGEKMEYLDGSQDFIKTIDMRPEIYAIAQVEGKYDSKKGIATWAFTSLDPMTMEPTDDVMSGFLPVNYNGTSGIGEVFFDVNLKQKFANGTQIPNRASIVFDGNEVILTPTWTNTIDAIAPSSSITACEIKNDTTATLHLAGTDNLSGVWKYDVYVQYGEGASWYKYATGVADSVCDVRIYEGINHGFYVVATDSAGNAEVKEAGREYTLDLFGPTEDSDLELELAAGWNWISHNLNGSVAATKVDAHAQRILGQEEETIKDDVLGFIGDLSELKPTLGYKIQMQQAADIALQGKLFNASYKSIALSESWNWIGYPLAHEMELAQALEHFTPGSGDYIVGQDGFAQYADGQWTGTLTTLVPGQGYLYKSGAAKQMFFNATATLSSRVESKRRAASEQNPWTCDKHKYPNVMPVIANLYLGNTAEDAADYHVAAFCGNECRGVGKAVNGYMMMSVYGEAGEAITFKAIAKDSELLLDVAESVNFTADAVGTLDAPYRMTIGGDANGIAEIASGQMKISPAVIRDRMTVTLGTSHSLRLTIANANGQTVGSWKKLADGSTVDVSSLPAGVYVVTVKAGKQVFTKKVMKVLTSE